MTQQSTEFDKAMNNDTFDSMTLEEMIDELEESGYLTPDELEDAKERVNDLQARKAHNAKAKSALAELRAFL